MSLTELPLSLPGRVFRSPMPFGPYDPHGEFMTDFMRNRLRSLSSWRAMKNVSIRRGCNLRALYRRAGFQVLYLPMPDFGVPTPEDLEQAVQHTIAYAQAGHHIGFTAQRALGELGCLPPTWQSGIWVSLVLRLSSGFDTISPMRSKRLSNNGYYSIWSNGAGFVQLSQVSGKRGTKAIKCAEAMREVLCYTAGVRNLGSHGWGLSFCVRWKMLNPSPSTMKSGISGG